jgi:hypothetical protein
MQAFISNRKISALLAAVSFAVAACSAPRQKPAHEMEFIVMGNTSPASPFTGYAEKLEYVFRCVNQENPVLVIHTGNIIQGGSESMGITTQDITRQYRKFLRQKMVLRPILHILAGEKDLYNNSLEVFKQFIAEKLFYSFNYGNAHIILLHVLNSSHRLDPEQMKWLTKDLEKHRYDAAIFVITHYPVLSSPQSGIRYQRGDELHKLFVRYPVKAVISGSMKNMYEYEKDGIRYITAGCFGFNYEDWHWSYNQYYIVHYDGARVTVKGVRVNFPGNTYRPKMLNSEQEKKN